MYENPPFSTVANWTGSSTTLPDGPAAIDTSFAEGQALSQWLQIIGASQTQGEIPIATVKQDFSYVNSPAQPWLTLNSPGNPVMQFVFDTPVNANIQAQMWAYLRSDATMAPLDPTVLLA